jgi:hypothetical protein
MIKTHRLSTTGVLMVCLIGTQWSGVLFASQEERPWITAPSEVQQSIVEPSPSLGPFSPQALRATPMLASLEAEGFGQRGGSRGRGRGRNGAAQAAIVLGAAASIAGTAVLVYANRPECSANHAANGCGYGTKVTGTAVLSAGIVALVVGALSWR